MTHQKAIQLLVLCLLVAAALRIPGITEAPPGLHYDEAANGILAGDIGLRGARPIFITSYTGKEVLFFYLAGALMRFLGESVFTLRLTSAYVGLLTIATTYWLGRQLLSDRRIALVASALLAVSFWHILFSRLGFRAITQPLLEAISIGALFYGLRRPSWPAFIIAGIALGLTAYTYLAARLFPLPLIIAFVPLLVGKTRLTGRWKQLAAFILAGLVTLMPLLYFFNTQPNAFWVRINQVRPEGGTLAALADSTVKSLGMYFLSGDPYWRFNIPLRPVLNWFWAGLAIAGYIFLLLSYRRQTKDWQRSSVILLLSIPLFMLLPTALAIGDIVPSNLRAVGVLPFLYFLPAVGLVRLLSWTKRVLMNFMEMLDSPPKWLQSLGRLTRDQANGMAVIIAVILIWGGVTTAQAYFREWANRTDLFYDSDGDLVAAAEFLEDMERDDKPLYVSALHYRHPTVAFLSERYDQIKWLPNSQAVVFPEDGKAGYLFPHNSPLPEWATEYFPRVPNEIGPDGPDGVPTFTYYEIDPPTNFTPQVALNTNFGNLVTLLGYGFEPPQESDVLAVKLYWRVENRPPGNLMPFIHIEDEWGYRWSQAESFAYPAEQWTPGETIVQQMEVLLPPGMPPDAYRLRIGMFDPETGQQVARLDDQGRYAGNGVTVEDVFLENSEPPENLDQAQQVLEKRVSDNLSLLAYQRDEGPVEAGARFWLSLWWQADGPLTEMASRLELVRPDNTGRVLLNTSPTHGTYPFADWSTPRFVMDHQTPQIPASFPTGNYTLVLRLLDGADNTLSTVDLGPLTVTAANRQFEAPASQYPQDALYGDQIKLIGYDLEPNSEQDQYHLTLVWQATTEPVDSYTVFVHLLDQDGSCCLWQKDSIPVQGTSSTDGWLPGEVVVDEYVIELPEEVVAGTYPLEVGLYNADTGVRLLVTAPGLRDSDALYLRPLQID